MIQSKFSTIIDMSNWPLPARVELLELVDKFEKQYSGQQPADETTEEPTAALLPEEIEPSGWTQEAYHEVIKRLLRRNHVQVAVIFEAIKNGTGYVSRDRVYELGNYPDTRSLKGFTRPVNRVTAEVVEAGLLEDDADELLTPDYTDGVTGYQRAKGFRVPAEIVKLGQQWRAEAEAKAAKQSA